MSASAPAMRLRVSEIAVWVRSMIRSISSLVLCMLAVVVRTRVRGLWNGINMLPSGIMRRERIVGSLSRHGHLKQMPMRQINTHVAAAIHEAAVAGQAVTLGVVKTNPALQLYERFGFRVTHADDRKFYMRREPENGYSN